MKALNVIIKILVALAAVAGAVYVAATYGDRIVAWAKQLLSRFDACKDCECNCDGECTCECDCEGECPCDGECRNCTVEEEAEEVIDAPAAEEAPVAAEVDFEN